MPCRTSRKNLPSYPYCIVFEPAVVIILNPTYLERADGFVRPLLVGLRRVLLWSCVDVHLPRDGHGYEQVKMPGRSRRVGQVRYAVLDRKSVV